MLEVLSPSEELILNINGQEHERPAGRCPLRRAAREAGAFFPASPSSPPSAASSCGAPCGAGGVTAHVSGIVALCRYKEL